MRKIVHRHLGKVVAGAAIAVAGTAVMVGITLPGTAGADETGGGKAGTQAARQDGAVPAGVVEQAPAEGDKGKGGDPLTDDEMNRAAQLAANRQLLNSAENVDGKRGPQRLSVDLADPENDETDDPNPPRRADVTFYDYKNDTFVTKTVNLDTGKVEDTGVQHGVQPPLSRAENAEAAALLIADPLGAGLKADYKDATGKELTSPDQLLFNGAVYRATPGSQPAVLDKCGEHRCVRLFPKVKNGPWIDARSIVIDLSARKVAQLKRG
ncbi:Tat pathway signal sequence domain protein [Streptomyces cylindrosporus]|uniref:Tat pathway signal sequence domain protein n=1 Tax=Streptomyces cylindrosporus TaxID=2927583 RepID=A0ABS9Y320_9ACTN|nr:Tat pathway signal sequence domain protein [Streptomyces cylindrosporus]MCI3271590.1 Tat pathway signal sequence domain protein [Streptomyces cylindrosporus]